MRIGLDVKRAFVNKSGLGNYSRDIITSLYDFFPEHDYFLFSPYSNTDLLNKKYLNNIVTTKSNTKPGKSIWRSLKMGDDIERCNLDIFHGLSNELPANIKDVKAKKIVTIHDLIFLRYPSLYNVIDRQIYKYKFKKACINSDKIIAISKQTKTDIIELYNVPESKIEVIYQSCNENFSTLLNDDIKNRIKKKYNLPDSFILTVGTIERRKNVFNVIKAIFYNRIDINYVVIGKKTEYYSEIKRFVDRNNLQNRILFLSNVSNEDLPAIYQLSKAFIYPSVYEGFGIPILEAFNSGIPVVTSNIGAMSEVGGEAALQVNPVDIEEISENIKQVLNDSELFSELKRKGLERAGKFERKAVVNNLMNFYKGLYEENIR